MAEPDVTLTDYALALECALFAYLLGRQHVADRALKIFSLLFFEALVVASFCGGTVHGFFPPGTMAYEILWRGTLVSVGVVALASWSIGACLVLSGELKTRVISAAGIFFLGYAIYVIGIDQRFVAAIIGYLPSTLFLLGCFLSLAKQGRRGGGLGVTGVVLTLAASGLQQAGVGFHPVYFNHNAVYHLVEAVALWVIFLALIRLNAEEQTGALPLASPVGGR